MAVFQVSVTNSSGQSLAGVALRLLAPGGADITATRFGASPVYTDANGLFTRFYVSTLIVFGLPAGIYTLVLSATGYVSQSIATANTFTGAGTYAVQLSTTPTSGTLTLSEPEFDYVSPLAPVEFTAQGLSPTAPWEYIVATVTDDQSRTSVIEVPVIGGQARINLQARLELDPIPWLVSDGDAGVIDADFARKFNITLASLTNTGSVPVTNTFSIRSANAFPTGNENDLSNFTNAAGPGLDGLADWLTPWDELPKFLGHYADVGIWLPTAIAPGRTLRTQFQDINRVVLSTTSTALPDALFASGKVVKIRIPEPVSGAHYAVLTIRTSADAALTHPLTVRYIHG